MMHGRTLKLLHMILIVAFAHTWNGCACSKLWHGNQPVATPVVVQNGGTEAICGVYIYRPQDVGGTGMVRTSPEMNNLLKPGSYILHENHENALQPASEVTFPFKVPVGERFTVIARNCEDNIVYQREDVCLRTVSPIVLGLDQNS